LIDYVERGDEESEWRFPLLADPVEHEEGNHSIAEVYRARKKELDDGSGTHVRVGAQHDRKTQRTR